MISADGKITASAIDSADIVSRAAEIHSTSPTASAALGRVLSVASIMGSGLKASGGSVTLQFKGGGPGGTIVAVSDSGGNVRGYAQNPQLDCGRRPDGKLDVGGYVGAEGSLTVIKDLNMREPYIGTVSLLGGEIAEDIAAYYAESEQIPTACAAGVLVSGAGEILHAGAYLVQLMPGADDSDAERLERSVIKAGAITELLRGGLAPREILERVLSGFETRVLDEGEAEYRCYCSAARVEAAIISAGRAEIDAMIREQQGAEVTCQFCDRVYRFSEEELVRLLEETV
jgi:molecular chaperone Hsp33